MNKILFVVNGPLGKNIIATGVAMNIAKYQECTIHVQSSHPDVFMNLDFVEKVFPLEPIPYFYDEHKDFEIIRVEPFEDLDYRKGNIHLANAWTTKIIGKTDDDERGIIILDEMEKKTGEYVIQKIAQKKKVIAFQPFGGNYSNEKMNQFKQPRDLNQEKAQEIVNKLVGAGYTVLHIGFPNEMILKNVIPLNKIFKEEIVSDRMLFSVINACDHCISIDSFLNHAWVALGKKDATVLWGNTSPNSLGYDCNNNLSNNESCKNIHCNRPSVLGDFIGNRKIWKCPYNVKCMDFDSDMVVKSFVESITLQPQNK